jgi:TPR repeat protein
MTHWIPFFLRRLGNLVLACTWLAASERAIAIGAGGGGSTGYVPIAELVKQMQDKPLEEIRRDAEGGDLKSQHYLGYCYVSGLRVEANAENAISWYQRAGKGGYPASYCNLGVLYSEGTIVLRDDSKAIAFFQLAIDGGFLKAKVNLGKLYQQRLGDDRKAAALFQEASEAGSYEAMCELYEVLWSGKGAPRNEEAAVNWLTKAGEAGDPYAQCLLGYHYNERIIRFVGPEMRLTEADSQKALHWFTLSAARNWAGGQYFLGLFYLNGRAVAQDEERGLDLMRKAADQGHSASLCKLAWLYQRNIGEPRSEDDNPVNLLLRAVRNGSTDAYAQLDYRYRNGLGVKRDVLEGARWHLKAADSSRFYVPGKLTDEVSSPEAPNDPFYTALRLYLRAGKLDDANALVEVAQHYLAGDMVPKDATKAWLWSSLARQKNAANGATQVAEAEKRMTAEELKSAKESLPQFVADLTKMAPFLQMEAQVRRGR